MAYEKHTWACGETITEAKLNNIEDGIEEALECCGGGGALIIEGDILDGSELNHTFAEIREAFASGRGVIYHYVTSQPFSEATPWYTSNILLSDGNITNTRYVDVYNSLLNAYTRYVADSDDDYPYIPFNESE